MSIKYRYQKQEEIPAEFAAQYVEKGEPLERVRSVVHAVHDGRAGA